MARRRLCLLYLQQSVGASLGRRSDCKDTQNLITPSPQTLNEGELQQGKAPFTLTGERRTVSGSSTGLRSTSSASGGANFSTLMTESLLD